MSDTERSISYHTFLYPIKISGSGKITELPQWDSEDEERFRMRSGRAASQENEELRKEELLFINSLRFFLPIARDFLAPAPDSAKNRPRNKAGTDSTPRYFHYRGINDREGQCSTYVIETTGGERFELTLTGIRLMLLDKYNVGILRFETEYTSSLKGAAFLAKVKKINDLGRRVYSPCFDTSGGDRILVTAKKITIAKKYTITFPSPKDKLEISAFTQLLFDKATAHRISGILDDRMFTACIVCDKALSESIAREKSNVLTNQSLYEYAFLDQEGDCSCQSEQMLEEQLRQHSYTRWKGYGTCHFITEYSMTAITGSETDRKYDVVNPFLTMYVEMVQLALLQRVILVTLEENAETISAHIDLKEVKQIWEKYILFQNTLYMREVTFQQQGAELYDMIKRALRIESMNDYLRQELLQFEEYSEMKHGEVQQEITGAFTDIALIGTVNTFLAALSKYESWNLTAFVVCVICLGACIYLSARLSFGVKKQWRDNPKGLPRLIIYLLLVICVILLYFPTVRNIWNSLSLYLSS